MNSNSGSLLQIVVPLRAIAQRFTYVALVLLCVALILLSKAGVAPIERVRMMTADVMAPVLSAVSRPVTFAEDSVARVKSMWLLYQENQSLRADNAHLLQWQQVARQLATENQALRDLSKYQPSNATWSISARVIGSSGGAYSRNLLLDRGLTDGVVKGQAAVSGTGLVGRVAEVGSRAARILLLTDINSRIPVTLETSRERAILAGDNSERPVLIYLSQNAKVAVGDRLVTSGDGGVFPPGISVGRVSEIGTQIRVSPTSDLSTMDYLQIVDYGLSGVLPQEAVPRPKPATKADRVEASTPP